MSMPNWVRIPSGRNSARSKGFSLIELMIAITVLAIGLAGILPLVVMATNSNSANQRDSQAVMIAQMVMEQIAARPASVNTAFTITDCRPAALGGPQNLDVEIAAGGANVYPATVVPANLAGNIDYSQGINAVPAGYGMQYYACGVGNAAPTDGSQLIYDVRWNIAITGGTMKAVTVAARRLNTPGGNTQLQMLLFVNPVTLRTIVS
jgi:prepilin-type N-terminal cleavage/methylation domain-containing protein